jgi:hypothetical protein
MKVRLNLANKDEEVEIDFERNNNCTIETFSDRCFQLSMSLNTAKLLSAKLDSVLESV